jgi:hypothetical protein
MAVQHRAGERVILDKPLQVRPDGIHHRAFAATTRILVKTDHRRQK